MHSIGPLLAPALCDSRGGGIAINASPSGQLPGWPVRLQRSACGARAACHHQRGHYAVEQAIRAQFGDRIRPFEVLRRRRNELEYPYLPADTAHVAGNPDMHVLAAGWIVVQGARERMFRLAALAPCACSRSLACRPVDLICVL
jgi:hypothetical protein